MLFLFSFCSAKKTFGMWHRRNRGLGIVIVKGMGRGQERGSKRELIKRRLREPGEKPGKGINPSSPTLPAHSILTQIDTTEPTEPAL